MKNKKRITKVSTKVGIVLVALFVIVFAILVDINTVNPTGQFTVTSSDTTTQPLQQQSSQQQQQIIPENPRSGQTLIEDGETVYIQGSGLVSKKSAEGITYYHQDYLSSNRFSTSEDEKLSSKSTYYPYGSTLNEAGAVSSYKFTGKEKDDGLYYYGARYYDPSTARFVSTDPVFSPAISPYAYAADNPLKYNDPTGAVISFRPGAEEQIKNTYGVNAKDMIATSPTLTEISKAKEIVEIGFATTQREKDYFKKSMGGGVKVDVKNPSPGVRGITPVNKDARFIVLLYNMPDTANLISSIVHESIHAQMDISGKTIGKGVNLQTPESTNFFQVLEEMSVSSETFSEMRNFEKSPAFRNVDFGKPNNPLRQSAGYYMQKKYYFMLNALDVTSSDFSQLATMYKQYSDPNIERFFYENGYNVPDQYKQVEKAFNQRLNGR